MGEPKMDQNPTVTGVNTFVFLDTETTCVRRPKFTEISLIAVHRSSLADSTEGRGPPRVQDRLVLCSNPGRFIDPFVQQLTGLTNEDLEDSRKPFFDVDTVELMMAFLRRQDAPVCLLAHNGDQFDFGVLRSEVMKVEMELPDDILCADTKKGFIEIDNTHPTEKPTRDPSCGTVTFKKVSDKYSMENLHQRIFGGPVVDAHSAEGDTVALLNMAATYGERFRLWVDKNAVSFNATKMRYPPSPMRSKTPGYPSVLRCGQLSPKPLFPPPSALPGPPSTEISSDPPGTGPPAKKQLLTDDKQPTSN